MVLCFLFLFICSSPVYFQATRFSHPCSSCYSAPSVFLVFYLSFPFHVSQAAIHAAFYIIIRCCLRSPDDNVYVKRFNALVVQIWHMSTCVSLFNFRLILGVLYCISCESTLLSSCGSEKAWYSAHLSRSESWEAAFRLTTPPNKKINEAISVM